MRRRKQEPEKPSGPYEGDVCFASDGWFYPVLHDADGNDLGPDKSRPLVHDGGQFIHAQPEHNNHFHTYGLQEKELVPGEPE